MQVNGVGNSGVIRTEQVRNEKRTEENNRAEEQKKKTQADQRSNEVRQQPQGSDRSENVDLTA
ncbi:MAG: hypothetical protein JW915_14415 [Chitinispirillaceae bacterium]|nr:hypothetical protein [Chitinispirillaceae bacterium]